MKTYEFEVTHKISLVRTVTMKAKTEDEAEAAVDLTIPDGWEETDCETNAELL